MNEYKFRIATIDDLYSIVRMCKDFFRASAYSSMFEEDEDRIVQYVQWYLSSPTNTAVVVLMDHVETNETVGMLAMLSSLLPFRFEFMAYEQIWWVDPEHRKGKVALVMLDIVEEWAKKVGCKMVSLTALEPSPVGRLYKIKGYSLTEQAYVKRI